jgi:hypothetical protein
MIRIEIRRERGLRLHSPNEMSLGHSIHLPLSLSIHPSSPFHIAIGICYLEVTPYYFS